MRAMVQKYSDSIAGFLDKNAGSVAAFSENNFLAAVTGQLVDTAKQAPGWRGTVKA